MSWQSILRKNVPKGTEIDMKQVLRDLEEGKIEPGDQPGHLNAKGHFAMNEDVYGMTLDEILADESELSKFGIEDKDFKITLELIEKGDKYTLQVGSSGHFELFSGDEEIQDIPVEIMGEIDITLYAQDMYTISIPHKVVGYDNGKILIDITPKVMSVSESWK